MTAVPGWRRAAIWTAVATVLAAAFMVATSMGPDLVLIAGLGILVGAAVWLLAGLARTVGMAMPWDTQARPAPVDVGTEGVEWWTRYRVPSGPRDRRSAERLHATLVEIIDDRLAVHHGVDRKHDPAAARAILGDDLGRFAADPGAAQSLTRLRTVERVVARIEQI